MKALTAQIEGIGVLGPGFGDWPAAAAVLSGSVAGNGQATVVPLLAVLPSAERRRAALIVRLAIAAGLQATAAAERLPAQLPSIFASSGGDGPNCHELCSVLASDRQVSPTRFHNAVHPAAAGYWSIATGAKTSSGALSAHDASFAAGLLEALVLVASEASPVLFIAYDAPYPQPLHAVRPIADAFAVAMVLSPLTPATPFARLSVTISDGVASNLADARLEALRRSIPAARSLPLLRLLARREAGVVNLDYLDDRCIGIEVTP
jgi:hypothetical protein